MVDRSKMGDKRIVVVIDFWDFGQRCIVDDFTSAVLRNRVQGVTARPGPEREDGPWALGCGPIHGGAEMFMVQSQGLLLTSQ